MAKAENSVFSTQNGTQAAVKLSQEFALKAPLKSSYCAVFIGTTMLIPFVKMHQGPQISLKFTAFPFFQSYSNPYNFLFHTYKHPSQWKKTT